MRSVVSLAVASALLLAGCFGSPDPQTLSPTQEPVDEYIFEATGEDPTWILLELPLWEPTRAFGGVYRVDLFVAGDAQGPSVLAYHVPAMFGEDSTAYTGIDSWRFHHDVQGGELEWSADQGFSASSSEDLLGLVFPLIVTGEWEVRFEVSAIGLDVDAVVEHIVPVEVAAWDVPVSQTGQTTPVIGSGSLRAEIPLAGWTHLELIQDRLQPVEARVIELQFPNGASQTTIGYGHGVGCQQFSTMADTWGMPGTEAGTLSADLVYTGTVLGATWRVLHVSLPTELWPDYLDVDSIYWASNPVC